SRPDSRRRGTSTCRRVFGFRRADKNNRTSPKALDAPTIFGNCDRATGYRRCQRAPRDPVSPKTRISARRCKPTSLAPDSSTRGFHGIDRSSFDGATPRLLESVQKLREFLRPVLDSLCRSGNWQDTEKAEHPACLNPPTARCPG